MTSAVLWPALLAAAAAGCLLGVPGAAGSRLQQVVELPRRAGRLPSAAVRRVRPAGGLAALGGALGLAVLAGPVPGVLGAAAALAAARARRSRIVSTRRRDERARAVEACAALAAELRAGRSPADALLAAADLATGPSRAALSAAAGAARLGSDPAVALGPPDGTAVPEVLRSLAACWTVCSASGSGLAAAVERLEEGLRAEQARRRAVDAELAGPRATAVLLAVLPGAGLLLAGGLGADPLHVLLGTPVGLVCLTGGVLLDGLGLWWTGRMVARAGGTA